LRRLASRAVFQSSWLTRRVLIEDGFLHTRRPPVDLRASPVPVPHVGAG
jgi:hypothetical protein